ncbi:hypothetical protein [Erythrobacter sp. 3-20A1M]|uniref:hypothetical protein n=1 Tax=Erythrobacter sp. 3-20A1M TaxID=2653850 RepID=UPI0020404BF0|nr:hypothetical protein [Erythrobacter sp. 3-20A1M]
MAIAVIKGSLSGALVTWLVALFIGSSGSTGAQLAIHKIYFEQHSFYWSWPLFLGLTVLFASIVWLMDS